MEIKVKVKKIVETEEELSFSMPDIGMVWEELDRIKKHTYHCLLSAMGLSSKSCGNTPCSKCVFNRDNAKYIK